jgi:hypothetical protein
LAQLLTDGSNRAFVTDNHRLSFLEKSLNRSKKFTKLNEKILSDSWGFIFGTQDFMFDAFDRKISQLVEAGISQKIIKNALKVAEKPIDDSVVTLTMGHLDIWFFVLLIMLTVSGAVFVGEVLYHWKGALAIKQQK